MVQVFQFELEGTGLASKKQLNQIQCICTTTSGQGWPGVGIGPTSATAFTDTTTSTVAPFPQTHTERLRIQPGKFAHVIVDGGDTGVGAGDEQGWSAPKPDPGRMIYWSDDKMIGQMSYINDIQYGTLGPGGACSQLAGLALAHDSSVVTSRVAVQATNTEGWLITPPHIVPRLMDDPAPSNSILCTSTYGMIGNTLLGGVPGTTVTIDNIFVTAIAAGGAIPPAGTAVTPCHGTQLILTKVERTNQDLIIRDRSVGGGNICISSMASPWVIPQLPGPAPFIPAPGAGGGTYTIASRNSATISFIWNMAIDGNPAVSGRGWHCTGFHMNV